MEHKKCWLRLSPSIDGPEAPYDPLDNMNIHNTKVNGHLLRQKIKNLSFNERWALENINQGKSFLDFKPLASIAVGILVAYGVALYLEAPWGVSLALWALAGLYLYILPTIYRKEIGYKQKFDRLAAEIIRDEQVVAAIFEGYEGIWANRQFRFDTNAFLYAVDWTRAEILKIVIQIESGNEAMRRELKIKFNIAKKLFGDYLDFNRGYDCYYSRQILEHMKDHKEGFNLPAVIMS